jgi:hypothetical protein
MRKISLNFNYPSFMAGLLIGSVGIMASYELPKSNVHNAAPLSKSPKSVHNYVTPNNIYLGLADVNNDGKIDIIAKYNGLEYLLSIDEHGRPEFVQYDILK